MIFALAGHFVEIYADKTKLDRGLKQISGQLRAFGAGISALGKKFMLLGVGIVTPLLAAAKHFMTVGDQLDKMSRRTGVSTNALSELGFAAEQSGASIEDVERSIKLMQKAIGKATEGPLKTLQGLSPEDQFMAMADALNKIKDPTQRTATALKVFGRAGTALLPMIGDVRALREEARRLGLSMGPEQAKQAAELHDAWNRVTRSFGAVAVAIGSTLAPMLTGLADKVKDGIGEIRDWIAGHRLLIITVFAAGVAAVAAGAGLIVFGKAVALTGTLVGFMTVAVKAATTALAFMGAATAVLSNPYLLLGAAVLALGGYLLYATGAFKSASTWIGQTMHDLSKEVMSSLGVMADSMAAGDFAAAAKVGWALVKLEWEKGMVFISTLWERVKDGWDWFCSGLTAGMVNAAASIQNVWAEMLGFLNKQLIGFMTSGPARMFLTLGMSAEEKKWANVGLDLMRAAAPAIDNITAAQKKAIAVAKNQGLFDLTAGLWTRHGEREGNIKALQDDLARARAEWEAAKNEAVVGAAKAAWTPPGIPGFEFGVSQSKVAGTFFASAVAGLGHGGIQERIAKGVEGTRKEAERMAKALEELDLEAEA